MPDAHARVRAMVRGGTAPEGARWLLSVGQVVRLAPVRMLRGLGVELDRRAAPPGFNEDGRVIYRIASAQIVRVHAQIDEAEAVITGGSAQIAAGDPVLVALSVHGAAAPVVD